MSACVLAAGCDSGTPETEPGAGPDLHVIATYPVAEAGTECLPDGPRDCGVPVNVAFQFRFDRYLRPATISRAVLQVFSADRAIFVGANPEYDVVERVLTFRPSGSLIPGILYSLQLKLADENNPGLEAFDGAPLALGPVPLSFHFFTARAPVAAETAVGLELASAPNAPVPVPCEQMVALFDAAGCANAGCHAGTASAAASGLDLSSERAIAQTAVNRVARQTDLGDGAGVVLENPSRFGLGMALVHPGKPENSYLLYKLLRNPENYRDSSGEACSSRHPVELPPRSCTAPSAAESERLRDWFVLGAPMPVPSTELLPSAVLSPLRFPSSAAPRSAAGLGRQGLDQVQQWIASGADCR